MGKQIKNNKSAIFSDIKPANKNINQPKKSRYKKQFDVFFKKAKIYSFNVYKRIKKIPYIKLILIALVVMAVFLYFANNINKPKNSDNPINETMANNNQSDLIKGKPDFDVITPNGKSIDNLDGWVNSKTDKPVFVYVDKLNKVDIRVSQQPMPTDFKNDLDKQVESLAKSAKANSKITISGNNVYIGNTSKGPQSVIFSKNELLIIITSDNKINNNFWAEYINSLR